MDNPAQPFADMAARIAKMDAAEFAGAIVIVPPGDGKVIAFLALDPSPDVAQFFTSLSTRIEIASAEARDAETRAANSPFGRR